MCTPVHRRRMIAIRGMGRDALKLRYRRRESYRGPNVGPWRAKYVALVHQFEHSWFVSLCYWQADVRYDVVCDYMAC